MMTISPDALEANYLDVIWARKEGTRAQRLEALQWLAAVIIPRGEEWDYATVRAETAPRGLEEDCFVCRNVIRRIYWHHVIQVQHGGSNRSRNLVPLCHECHRAIHPWLPPATSHENKRGWTKVGDMMPWLFRLLERVLGAKK